MIWWSTLGHLFASNLSSGPDIHLWAESMPSALYPSSFTKIYHSSSAKSTFLVILFPKSWSWGWYGSLHYSGVMKPAGRLLFPIWAPTNDLRVYLPLGLRRSTWSAIYVSLSSFMAWFRPSWFGMQAVQNMEIWRARKIRWIRRFWGALPRQQAQEITYTHDTVCAIRLPHATKLSTFHTIFNMYFHHKKHIRFFLKKSCDWYMNITWQLIWVQLPK